MNDNQIRQKLIKAIGEDGSVEVCSVTPRTLTLLIIGGGLTNMDTVIGIQKILSETDYNKIEVMKNESHFFLQVLTKNRINS